MNIQIQSGSPRKDSLSVRVAKAIHKHVGAEHTSSIVDFNNYDIPFLNAGRVNKEAYTPFQKQLIEGWDAADLVFVISPEYNWFPSAEIINTIHQLGSPDYKHLFDNKVFAFVGVSSGRGGRIPAMQLTTIYNKLFNVFSTHAISSGKTFESQFTGQTLDENGNSLGNAEYDKGLSAFVDYSVELSQRWVNGKS